MKSSLLSGFEKNDKSTWKKKAEKELKDRTYSDLLFRPAEGVEVEPYYVEAELPTPELLRDIQACQRKQPGWLTVPAIRFDTPVAANEKIRTHLASGADAVWLDCGATSLTHLELAKTLNSVRLTDTPVFLDTAESPAGLLPELGLGMGYYLKGGLVHDPLADWMRTGKAPQAAFDGITEGMRLTKMMREFRPYKVESHVFHEAGADVVQELALTLASFVTYLDQLTERGVAALLAVNRVLFSMSIGPEYLTEIAKIRALRYLYRQITRAYSLPDELCQAQIHSRNSRLYLSTRSPHTNQIRISSEAMSAVIGGCDALTLDSYDEGFREPTEFSERMARNVSLILKDESYLDKVADPAAGSYYLEIVTHKLIEATWKKFLIIENQGGLIKAFEQNLIQEEIKKSWNDRVAAYQNGKVLVGVNKYRDGDAAEAPLGNPPVEVLSPSWEYALLPVRNLDGIF